MALNRYRLKHLKANGHRGARKASRLLKRPDRLIGLILIGNNLVNIAAASLATAICVRLYGDAGYAIATVSLTLIVLVFAEVTPKTYAALHPEHIAFPASYILQPLQTAFYPLVYLTNFISNTIVKLLGGDPEKTGKDDALSFEELKILVQESVGQIPIKRHGILMNVLDLETVEVDDIMIPRNEIYAIDINSEAQVIFDQVRTSEYTRVLLYRDELDDLIGVVHLRQSFRFLKTAEPENANGDNVNSSNKTITIDKRAMIEAASEPYFVPEGTPLHTQLFNFQREKRRIGVVVDEYGVVQGLVTIEDILEEIVGDYTTNFAEQFADVTDIGDGNFTITGSANVRDINRQLSWSLPTDGPKTLNGLILEHLESFPDGSGVGLTIGDYMFEVLDIQDNRINSVNARVANKVTHSLFHDDATHNE